MRRCYKIGAGRGARVFLLSLREFAIEGGLSDFMKRNAGKCRVTDAGTEKMFNGIADLFCHNGGNGASSAFWADKRGDIFHIAVEIISFEMKRGPAFVHHVAALWACFFHFITFFLFVPSSKAACQGHIQLRFQPSLPKCVQAQCEHRPRMEEAREPSIAFCEDNLR